jgi:hypothetical protein
MLSAIQEASPSYESFSTADPVVEPGAGVATSAYGKDPFSPIV